MPEPREPEPQPEEPGEVCPARPAESQDLGGPDELRRRLRKGLRSRGIAPAPQGRPGASAPEPPPQAIVFRRDVPHRPPSPVPPAVARLGPPVPLSQAAPGVEVVAPDGARAYLVERTLHGAGGQWAGLSQSIERALGDRGSGLWAELASLGPPGAFGPRDLLLLDLETAGLGSCPLFLIGAMIWGPSGLIARQFFARDYSEERAALSLFLALAAGRRLLVSFNGKSFDLPFVRARAAANGLPCDLDPAHLDLLHAARRAWGEVLPDCRLQTLEHRICGRLRADDIPGHLIPDAYHEFVRTGNAVRMAAVLEHNFRDLVTLAELLVRMSAR